MDSLYELSQVAFKIRHNPREEFKYDREVTPRCEIISPESEVSAINEAQVTAYPDVYSYQHA